MCPEDKSLQDKSYRLSGNVPHRQGASAALEPPARLLRQGHVRRQLRHRLVQKGIGLRLRLPDALHKTSERRLRVVSLVQRVKEKFIARPTSAASCAPDSYKKGIGLRLRLPKALCANATIWLQDKKKVTLVCSQLHHRLVQDRVGLRLGLPHALHKVKDLFLDRIKNPIFAASCTIDWYRVGLRLGLPDALHGNEATVKHFHV